MPRGGLLRGRRLCRGGSQHCEPQVRDARPLGPDASVRRRVMLGQTGRVHVGGLPFYLFAGASNKTRRRRPNHLKLNQKKRVAPKQ